MIDKNKIYELCNQNNFSCNYFGDSVVISTLMNQWMIESVRAKSGRTFIRLKHRNKSGNVSRKEHFHTQETFKSIERAINFINRHDYRDTLSDKYMKIKPTRYKIYK